MANLVCPECGVSLEGRSPAKHSRSHYPDFIPPYPQYETARKRQAALLKMESDRKKTTPADNPE